MLFFSDRRRTRRAQQEVISFVTIQPQIVGECNLLLSAIECDVRLPGTRIDLSNCRLQIDRTECLQGSGYAHVSSRRTGDHLKK